MNQLDVYYENLSLHKGRAVDIVYFDIGKTSAPISFSIIAK